MITRLKEGDFKYIGYERQEGDIVIATLLERDSDKGYRLFVKYLYGKHEEVISEEIIGEED